jgi:DNA (cytosine-5)-methyltransferase 1
MDIAAQPDYPFFFMQVNALNVTSDFLEHMGIKFIWASTPCQAYSRANEHLRQKGRTYPDLISPTRDLLSQSGLPWCMENVPGAPLRADLKLCGAMFKLRVIRHRDFEISGFKARQLPHRKHQGSAKAGDYVTVAGNGGNDSEHNYTILNGMEDASQLKVWQHAMGIDWIRDRKHLREAVPPAYSEYIFRQFMKGAQSK